jgi:hypothetical protein
VSPTAAMTADTETVGAALAGYLDGEMTAERAKKGSLESRALAVISSSGTLVTLLFGLAAVITKATSYAPSTATLVLLAIAAGLFAAASGLAIYCNVPGRYSEIEATSLRGLAGPAVWTTDGSEARRELALARIEILHDWQRMNDIKARVLFAAATGEVAGVLVAAAAVIVVLAAR